FFFQAEDGIRDFHVTGVQTCALPISSSSSPVRKARRASRLAKTPTSLPWSTTNNRRSPSSVNRRAAWSSDAVGSIDFTVGVITSPAVVARAFTHFRHSLVPASIDGILRRMPLSFTSRSASETTPSSVDSSSTTGTALIPRLTSTRATSLNGAVGGTVTTSVVMTSATVTLLIVTPPQSRRYLRKQTCRRAENP